MVESIILNLEENIEKKKYRIFEIREKIITSLYKSGFINDIQRKSVIVKVNGDSN